MRPHPKSLVLRSAALRVLRASEIPGLLYEQAVAAAARRRRIARQQPTTPIAVTARIRLLGSGTAGITTSMNCPPVPDPHVHL